MAIKFSELPVTTTPEDSNRVAVLDTSDNTLKTTTIQNLIDCADVEAGFTGTAAQVQAAIQSGDITNGMIVNITDDWEEGSGGGGDIGTELTQQEYNALTPEQKATGIYWITDGTSGGGITVDTSLDTTSSNPIANSAVATAVNSLNTLVGSASSASAVTGSDAFTKINTLNTDKQPKTMSQTIAGQTTVESCLSTINANLMAIQIDSGKNLFGTSAQSINITFNKQFTSIPNVVATVEGSKSYAMAECDGTVYVSSISKTGATLEINRVANNNPINVYWIAVV